MTSCTSPRRYAADRNRWSRDPPGQRSGRGWRCPTDCPSDGGASPVRHSNYLCELGGATGIRTPDLLHAMERRTVHHSPHQATRDRAELRIRSGQVTSVHESPPRTVTSLVTSPASGHADQKHQCPKRPPPLSLSPCPTSLARGPARRYRPASETGTPARPGISSSYPALGGRQCTPCSGDRTIGARAVARLEALPRRGFPGPVAPAGTGNLDTAAPGPLTRGADRADRFPWPHTIRRCQRSGRPA
jgi:hypothetical protein